MEQLLNKYIIESEIARQKLMEILNIPIASIDIQIGLAKHFGLDNSIEIISKELNSKDMITILKTFDFSKPSQSEAVWIKESILPHSLPQFLTEETIKMNGEKWVIHKYDKDKFPSNPHAHNYDTRVKLHLGTGELFNTKKVCVGKLKRKQLISFRNLIKNIKPLPSLSI